MSGPSERPIYRGYPHHTNKCGQTVGTAHLDVVLERRRSVSVVPERSQTSPDDDGTSA